MCTTCGGSNRAEAKLTDLQDGARRAIGTHERQHDRDGQHHGDEHHRSHDDGPTEHHHHEHDHAGAQRHGPTIALEQAILVKNDRIAERNRGWLEGRNILALNLVSAPGAGKTTLLERTIRALGGRPPISVIEGDQASSCDAERIRATGSRAVQINTGAGCHLDAQMVASALDQLAPPLRSLVMIENVGNLVCPALFDLGERAKVVILSVAEGEDKPLKYPHMFRDAGLMILHKIDLLPHVDFDAGRCIAYARRINPAIECLQLSARTGQGLEAWCDWLRQQVETDALAEPTL